MGRELRGRRRSDGTPGRHPRTPRSVEAPPEPSLQPPASGAAGPAAARAPRGAAEILDALRARLLERLPEWAARPEDPVNVLLEAVAEELAELYRGILGLEEHAARRLLDRLGIQPRPPRPARGVVVFEPDPAGFAGRPEAAIEIHPGTEIVASREAEGAGPPPGRAGFETEAELRVGAARLARVLAVDGIDLRDLPVDGGRGRAAGAASTGAPAGGTWEGSGVAAFGGRVSTGRGLYLGDEGFLGLREGGPLLVSWPGDPRWVAGVRWEYRVREGWRELPARFDEPGADGPRALRMRIEGALPDLARETLERADLPWIRCSLPPGPLDLDAPRIVAGAPGGGGAAGRPPERIFLAGPEGTLDLSFEERLAAPAAEAESEPALYLGWDGPAASTVYVELAGGGPPAAAPGGAAPRLAWEVSAGGGWDALPADRVRDRTLGLTRSGSLTATPPRGWEPRDLFGERLFWLRGRWSEGERPWPVAVRAVFHRAVEVIQGRTVEGLVLARAEEIEDGVLVLPALAEGEIDLFDRLEIRLPGERPEVWERRADLPAPGPGSRTFVLGRRSDGRAFARFGGGAPGRPLPPGDAEVVAPRLRVGIGAGGNLHAGALGTLVRGVAGIASVRNPLPTEGGEDVESPEALHLRVAAEWGSGGRAVTAADFDRLARALAPEAAGALVGPDPLRAGGLLVVLVPQPPRAPGRFPPALLTLVERELSSRAPVGTAVRVVEPAYLGVEVEAQVEPAPSDPAGAEEEAAAALRRHLDPIAGGDAGTGFDASRGLKDAEVARIILRVLGVGRRIERLRVLGRDRKPVPILESAWPPDLLVEIVAVRLTRG